MKQRYVVGGFLVSAVLVGCAPRQDQQQVDQAVKALASGSVVRAIEKNSQDASAVGTAQEHLMERWAAQAEVFAPGALQEKRLAMPDLSAESIFEVLNAADEIEAEAPIDSTQATPTSGEEQPPAPVVARDLCEGVADPAVNADDSVFEEKIGEFGDCVRGLMTVVRYQYLGIRYFKLFKLEDGQASLSSLGFSELVQYLIPRFGFLRPNLMIQMSVEQQALVRQGYTDEDLLEILTLYAQRRSLLGQLTQILKMSVEAKPNLFAHYQSLDRYRLLKALTDHADDTQGMDRATAMVAAVQGRLNVPGLGQLAQFPLDLLGAYAPLAAIAASGRDKEPLDPQQENPFVIAALQLSELQGPESFVNQVIANYRRVRDFGASAGAEVPDHALPHADAVRVAVLDTGVDHSRHPSLGVFLAKGRDGEQKSYHYGDRRENPWVPAVGIMSHGTGTYSTVLTILAQQAPELLRERKVDMAMWANRSIRGLLAGPPYEVGSPVYDSRMLSFLDAIVDQSQLAEDANSSVASPDIVSVSLAFAGQQYFQAAGQRDLIGKTPWLWVMAAGNSTRNVTEENYSCFADVPAEIRPSERILCVGALKPTAHGTLEVASYSNFGDAVDVYAKESYDALCPNGTSCSTPAVTGTAAVIKGRYPELTPEQIRRVIVESSVRQTLAVDLSRLRLTVEQILRRRLGIPEPARATPSPVQQQPSQLLFAAEGDEWVNLEQVEETVADFRELAAPANPPPATPPTLDPSLVDLVMQQIITANQIVTQRDVQVFDPATMTTFALQRAAAMRVAGGVVPSDLTGTMDASF